MKKVLQSWSQRSGSYMSAYVVLFLLNKLRKNKDTRICRNEYINSSLIKSKHKSINARLNII